MWTVRQIVEVLLQLVRGLWETMQSCRDLGELERAVMGLGQAVTGQLFKAALENMDERLMQERDRQQLKLVRIEERNLVTLFGEIRFKRRYYLDVASGRYRHLLDEALGLEPRQVLSPGLRQTVVKLATRVTYRQVGFVLEELLGGVHLSVMTLWKQVQAAGAMVRERAEALRKAVFDRGEVPAGTRSTAELYIEADEVWVPGRSEDGKRGVGLKVAVAYEGKAEVGPGRKALRGRRVVAGVEGPDRFWEHVTVDLGGVWDLDRVTRFTLGSDGAAWLKNGCRYFPGSTHQLDPYHLRRALVEGLSHHEEAYHKVVKGIANGNWTEVAGALREAAKSSQGAKRRRVRQLETYLGNNWDGIQNSGAGSKLGAIEGQVFHHAARRLKGHGGAWSERGVDHLARLLAADANGELQKLARDGWQIERELLQRAAGPTPIRAAVPAGEDPAAWLGATMPALHGPAAGKPWVKYVLRELARAGIDVA